LIHNELTHRTDSDLQVGLAISLHQATNEKRSPLMPVNNRFPVEELLDSCRYYISKTNRRVSFEWALINGQTDTPASAKELGKLLQGMLCHVNVIPLNPTKGYAGQPTPKVCNTCEAMRHDCNVYGCHRLGLMSLFGYWVSTV
jgi:adenine C2-methylase RlmN of 23S rRNA A2503 and tRNA A37